MFIFTTEYVYIPGECGPDVLKLDRPPVLPLCPPRGSCVYPPTPHRDWVASFTGETFSYRANGSNAKPMAPTRAESSDCRGCAPVDLLFSNSTDRASFRSDLRRTAACTCPPPYTMHPTPYTLHPTPYTLHPTPCTLHPAPYILHPTKRGGLRETAACTCLPHTVGATGLPRQEEYIYI